jgi:hypothetical protein
MAGVIHASHNAEAEGAARLHNGHLLQENGVRQRPCWLVRRKMKIKIYKKKDRKRKARRKAATHTYVHHKEKEKR